MSEAKKQKRWKKAYTGERHALLKSVVQSTFNLQKRAVRKFEQSIRGEEE